MSNKEPRTLLVVDDNSTNLSVLSEFLDSSGFKVLVAVDGESAIEQIEYSLPDLILLDVMMPGIDGFETCRRLKQNPATQDIPIIFMTAVADTASKVKGLKLGAVDYILKPFQREEVLARIGTQLRLRQEIQERTAAQAALQALTQELEQHIEQRTAQLQLAKEEAEVASRVKSQFLESMSHELRTPLNGILGYAQILERSQTVTQEDKKGVSIIYQCGTHLLTLVNDILELATIDHKIELYPTPCHFPDFMQSIAEIGRVRSQQKGITFMYQPTGPLPEIIKADAQRLQQVLVNLLGNAVKFTDSGRVILNVEAKPESQGQNSHSLTQIRFQVKDTGVGMNAEQVEQIFLPFEQVRDDRVAGSGLGLAISQKIVSTMGGTIQVTSQLGVGSVFEFEIEVPEAKPLSEPILDGKIVGYRGKKQKILVVDDLRTNRLVLINLLVPLGFEVIEASDGQEGLRKAMQLQPDLAIVDSLMPIMDGFEMMRYLRQSPQYKMAIIASSVDVFETDIHENLKAGADAFLPKPVQVKRLLELLGKHLQLEWIYQSSLNDSANASVLISPTQVVPPNPEMLTQLHCFAKKGDLDAIFREATQLNQTEKMRPFAQSVLQFVENFQVKKLQEFIEHYLEGNPSC